jgi:hypothetical protein
MKAWSISSAIKFKGPKGDWGKSWCSPAWGLGAQGVQAYVCSVAWDVGLSTAVGFHGGPLSLGKPEKGKGSSSLLGPCCSELGSNRLLPAGQANWGWQTLGVKAVCCCLREVFVCFWQATPVPRLWGFGKGRNVCFHLTRTWSSKDYWEMIRPCHRVTF